MWMMNWLKIQLEKISEIRLSERRFYHKIMDIYVTSLDYDAHAKSEFQKYTIIQDKLFESDFDRFLQLEDELKEEK